ncbi:DUF6898 family protein [Asticcacaulis endophyticus]|uniref:DUF6898 domain-containing protein n=1 Tax=Asticcacaulis endophyticus TaxID=1395890 RepID=A0A918QE14_9CAUL|nr:hypothetical protein [Asticcacaulis endophyticus]GGZ40906.1 hypothetical protein GCM10011273_29580 [Asticcacaulis endophyticus]
MSEVLLEYHRNGAYLKVTAVDPATGEEVSAMGPASNPTAVKSLAITKLQNKLAALRQTPPAKPGKFI